MKREISNGLLLILTVTLIVSMFASINFASAYTGTNVQDITRFYHDTADYNGAGSYNHIDYTTLHNGHVSIRSEADYVRYTRECDGAWIDSSIPGASNFAPGAHIYVEAYIKTAVYDSLDTQDGGTIGFDFYAQAHTAQGWKYGIVDVGTDYRGYGVQAGHPSSVELNNPVGGVGTFGHTLNGDSGMTQVSGLVCRVPYKEDWTLVQWDFYVPTAYYTLITNDATFPYPMACDPVQIDSMVVWFGGRNIYDTGYMWFSDTVMYVTPGGGTPTPAPSSTATPTPAPTGTPGPTPTTDPRRPFNSVNFAFQDLSGATASNGISWELYNGANYQAYTQGSNTLSNSTYTLKTYYLGHLVNSTDFYAPTYDKQTIPIHLNLRQSNFHSIIANNTVSTLVINSDTATAFSFSAIGTNGPYILVIPAASNALFVNANGVNVTAGSGWTYDSVNHAIVITSATLPSGI